MLNHTIIGAGAMGHLMAALLTTHDLPSTLVFRTKEDLGTHKVLHDRSKERPLSLNESTVDELDMLDVVWITVKSYQLRSVLESITTKLSANSWLILLQNGMGHIELASEVLQQAMPAEHIIAAANTHGAYLEKQPNLVKIHHSGIGQLTMGVNYLTEAEHKQPDFLAQLPDVMNCQWTPNLEQTLWQKLAINAVINPVTAHHQCRNGELLHLAQPKAEVEQLIEECVAFFKCKQMPALAEAFPALCYDVISQTAENYSSMMLDIKHGRETEIEAITGYLLNHANSVRLPMTGHQLQYHRLLNS